VALQRGASARCPARTHRGRLHSWARLQGALRGCDPEVPFR